jgi:peptidoglycan/xylan/chitin deacetylase (PgdA/CDA1 family)
METQGNHPDVFSKALGSLAGHAGSIILMYHSIDASSRIPDWTYAVSIKKFVEQINYLQSTGWSFLRLRDLATGTFTRSKQVVVTFDDAYSDTLHAAEILARKGIVASWFAVSSALQGRSTWVDPDTGTRPTMRPPDLRDLAAAGMEIGAHSATHRRLAEIGTGELSEETVRCKIELENALGFSVSSFSYPYGSYDSRVIEAVRLAGFNRACATDNGAVRESTDFFRLPRLAITAEDTISDFARKIFLVNDDSGFRGAIRTVRRALSYRDGRRSVRG